MYTHGLPVGTRVGPAHRVRRQQMHHQRINDLETQMRRVSRRTRAAGFGLELTHEPFERITCTNCVKCWVGVICLIAIIAIVFFLLAVFNVI
jgi:hypothetical protein